jgi:putative endopeptidase
MQKIIFKGLMLGISGLFLVSCGGGGQKEEAKSNPGIDLTAMDTSVNPADDFYRYANGNWIKNTKIPSTESRWTSFDILEEDNKAKLRNIMDEAMKNTSAPAGSNLRKIGDFLRVAMDSVKLNKDGIGPLLPYLAMADSLKSSADLVPMAARLHPIGARVLFGVYAYTDMRKSDEVAAYLGQSGLGLPDCDYYLKTDKESKELQAKYVSHVEKMFSLCGSDEANAKKAAASVMKIETDLAGASMNALAQRDIESQYNKMSIADLNKMAPGIDFNGYFKAIGAGELKEVIVTQPKFMKKLSSMMKSVSMEDWKAYYRWKIIDASCVYLSDALSLQNHEFFGKTLSGAKEMKPRWKSSLEMVDAYMGEALGQVYVEKYFSAESKKKVNEMVDNMMIVYQERIKSLDWMSDSTKTKALEKLNTIVRKLGYPDKWRDYSALEIGTESFLKNAFNATAFEFRRNLNKLGKPVDKLEWGMSPPTVNAYYNPTMNEIVFPAGIMQPPFFDPAADDPCNYARIAVVIGHEITHGFDDQGAQFDAQGNLKNWWNSEDKSKFEAKTKVVIDQFNEYVAIDSMHINGALTVGENVADLGGFSIAFAAMKKSLEGKPKPELIDGFTPEQRFFIAGAQMWRSIYTPEAMKKQVLTNPHSPGEWRVTGPFSNLPEFYEAFGVKPGNKMYREEAKRAKIW